jgi:DNA-directed RNA polymerase subunit RPC12/RpoP
MRWLTAPVPEVELDYACRKCGNAYLAAVGYSGRVEDLDLDGTQSRCPFCGEWNCADPRSVDRAVREGG